jgi:trigger factor
MKVLKSKRTKNTYNLEISASLNTIEIALTKTFKQYVKSAKIPGFRQGKAPRAIFEKHYGKEILLKDGLTEAVNIAYLKALDELTLEVIDYPRNLKINEYKENTPLTFTCEVDVRPEIKVSKYKGVKVEQESKIISEELINAQIKQIQNSATEYAIVDRAVEKEDLLKVNVNATIDETEFSKWTKENVGVGVGSSIFSEKFDENLIGKEKDKEITFNVKYDKDYYLKEVADKKVDFKVLITEVKGKIMPELTDELVAKSSQFKTVEELKTNIRSSLESQRNKEIDEKLRKDIIETISEKNPVEVPDSMINAEIEKDKLYYNNSLKKSGSTLDAYLKIIKQTEEDFTTQLKENAKTRLTQELVLDSISKQEKIEATKEDINSEIKILKPDADTQEKIDKEIQKINISGLKQMIIQRKTFEFLTEHAKITTKKS